MKNYFLHLALLFLMAFIPLTPLTAKQIESSKKTNKDSSNSSRKLPEFKYLSIIGCARSGTHYITQVLRECGVSVMHEAKGLHGTVSWLMTVNADKTPYGPGRNKFQFAHTFHQVRHPLKTMSSCTTEPMRCWLFISKHIPQIHPDEPLIVRCAKYWYYWNLHAEGKAEWTYRVEDIEKVLGEMGDRLGIDLDKNVLKNIPKDVAKRPWHENITWEDLRNNLDPELYINIVNLAKRYGYEVKD